MPSESCPFCEAKPVGMGVVGESDERFFGGHVDDNGTRHDGMRHEDGCLLVFPPQSLYIARHPDLPAPQFQPLIFAKKSVADQLESEGWEVAAFALEESL